MVGRVKAAEEVAPSIRTLTAATTEDVENWLVELKARKRQNGRAFCNSRQYVMIEKVARRVIREMQAQASDGEIDYGEPLRWCMHGGPGTGKSKAIEIIKEELFEQVLGWDMGVQFQVVALQAVMADLLGGDTIHHALGIPVFKKGECHGEDLQKHRRFQVEFRETESYMKMEAGIKVKT